MAGRETLKTWLPYIFQAIAILGAAWTYTSAQEHRLTAVEETMKMQSTFIMRQEQQINEIQITQARLIALEEYIHKKEK